MRRRLPKGTDGSGAKLLDELGQVENVQNAKDLENEAL